MSNLRLSRTERLILSNQYQILERLYPDDAEYLQQTRQALERGYALHYKDAVENIDEDELSAEDCVEVLDILSMFTALDRAYSKLTDKSGIDEWRVKFAGFDGNNESRLMGYTRYFFNYDGGRFKELHRGDDFNSHIPMLATYRTMLREWNKSADKNAPTKDDIIRITTRND